MLPAITHLQCLALYSLIDGEKPGRLVREFMFEHGEQSSGPKFYQMMSRMGRDGLIGMKMIQEIDGKQIIKESVYSISDRGREQVRLVSQFYRRLFQ